MSTPPMIATTTYREVASTGIWTQEAVWLPDAYLAPLRRAGGTAAVLPPDAPDRAGAALDRMDGLYLTGGYDVDPALYDAARHPETDAPRADRDAWELALLAAAVERGMPVLGVCRGAQLLNVARGGTLHQHVPDVVGHTGYQRGDAVFRPVEVSVQPGTLLARCHPARRAVPVYHHQAIDRLGRGLVVSARSADGLIEAIEDPSLAFCVAVQWHPEHDPGELGLWEAFVEASRAYAARA
ncbi:gamma-glutamyl-gamma-aminobutyrate hydrolase family protein [Demequina sp. SYSU T00039]|uniref:Gamma-glutamyl-gamma-aminobutyrate hydrolase family protein n=1 Tax=Demequina lignilytica TaxID=3051663 RepID=A0AAW7M0H4_9MICO|nr:gamma-glutamyl-gamma-aminobutyrate hydrolase family protein [Demequina sp. SYSU T00039]MDN4486644.1 gamma-glutamyl-gamma-aminobutyrate hydrolase family protein [Demequina sp. SYSU T00039]